MLNISCGIFSEIIKNKRLERVSKLGNLPKITDTENLKYVEGMYAFRYFSGHNQTNLTGPVVENIQ